MEIEKQAFFVSGTPNEKTKEKIRLRLRQLLNGHKKCILGLASKDDIPKIAYEFDLAGYQYLYFIYKSTSADKIKTYEVHFQSQYINELITVPHEDIKDTEMPPPGEPPFVLYLLGKSKKRVF